MNSGCPGLMPQIISFDILKVFVQIRGLRLIFGPIENDLSYVKMVGFSTTLLTANYRPRTKHVPSVQIWFAEYYIYKSAKMLNNLNVMFKHLRHNGCSIIWKLPFVCYYFHLHCQAVVFDIFRSANDSATELSSVFAPAVYLWIHHET